MADFSKLIEEANAAEQEVLVDANRADDKVQSLDSHREKTLPRRESTEKNPRSQHVDEDEQPFASNLEEPWTNFTTRLRKETKERLQKLCLERQISKRKPWGQQDLVEEAIVAIINKYSRS